MFNKIRYYIYSRCYIKRYTPALIKNLKNNNLIYQPARKNGKTRTAIMYQYIEAVENYDFKSAKLIKKLLRRYL